MANYLLRYYHPATGRWCDLQVTSQSVSIGRTPDNTLPLNDDLASPNHAALHFDERGIWVIDQNSASGVFLNGQWIPPGQWTLLPLNTNFTIGATTLRVEIMAPAAYPAGPVSAKPPGSQAKLAQAPVAYQPRQPGRSRFSMPLLVALIAVACLCLAGGGVAAYYYLPGLLAKQPALAGGTVQPGSTTPSSPAGSTAKPGLEAAPPTVIDSLAASAGGEAVKDDQGVSLTVPAGILQNGDQVSLERASLSPGMKDAVEKSYTVDSLAYAAKLPEGEDMIGSVTLALPAKSPEARLAVLVDDTFLGVLETPQQDGVFTVTPRAGVVSSGQGFPDPGSARQGATRYLVVTPKSGTTSVPQAGAKFANLVRQDDPDGKSCVAEKWTLSNCWRNADSTIYVFWKDDYPPEFKDQEYLRIVDTIKGIASIMSSYSSKGFTGAALTSAKPLYIVVEAGAKEPYYSNKTGNIYVNWNDIGEIAGGNSLCVMAHELFHWTESASYYMNAAAVSNPKSWFLEISAENGTFLLDTACIDGNLTTYGLVTTSDNVLGFQAAPFRWESNEQVRYVNALQFYLSLCDGGAGCALTQAAWISAINGGTYPMEGGAQAAYEKNAKDLGRYLLGAAPAESRAGAVIPPATATGSHYGDYVALLNSARGIWDYGLTMNQFSKPDDKKVKVEAKIFKGGAYPLMVSNGVANPLGRGGGQTGLPGILEIQPGPAFWIKQDQGDPVFYPEGKSLILGPISDKLGVGSARIAAIAPDADKTFQAALSLVDLSGDWTAQIGALVITSVDCPGYKKGDQSSNDDPYLQMLSAKGTYTLNTGSATDIGLTWQGALDEGLTAVSDVKVEPDKVTLHYTIDTPKPEDSGSTGWQPWTQVVQVARRMPGPRRVLWLSALPALPGVGVVTWLNRRRKRWARTGLAALVILSAWVLSGCFGFGMYGTIESTYTFNKLEYVGPSEIAQGAAPATGQDAPLWKLSDGQVEITLDLQILTEVTNSDGFTTKGSSPCKIKFTSTATATIGPEGSVKEPDNGG